MANSFDEWAILELMGHRKLAGKVTEESIGGASFVRIDIPDGATQFYSAAAIYCITPVDETLAVAAAGTFRPEPINRWELPDVPGSRLPDSPDAFDDGEDFDMP